MPLEWIMWAQLFEVPASTPAMSVIPGKIIEKPQIARTMNSSNNKGI